MMYSVHLSSTGRGRRWFKDKYIDVLIKRKLLKGRMMHINRDFNLKPVALFLKMNADAGKLPSFSLERMACSPLHKVLGY